MLEFPQTESLETLRLRLRWRARRGLLENDLLITRYLDKYETQMSDAEVIAFTQLLALSDNDLLKILLGQEEEVIEQYDDVMSKIIMQLRDEEKPYVKDED